MNSWNPYVERKEEANYSELKRVCFPRVKRRYLLKMLCIMLYMIIYDWIWYRSSRNVKNDMYFQLSVGEMIPLAPRMCQTFPQHAPCMCPYVPSMNSARSRLLPACSPPAPFCFLSCPQHVPRMFTYVPSAPTMLPPCSHHATAMFPPCSLNPRRLFVNQIVRSQRRGAICLQT